jgi:general stress protein 26
MNQDLENYEKVSIYQLDEDAREALLLGQTECVFNWCTSDNWPMGVVMSYIWRRGKLWLTTGGHRHRVSAIRRNPKVSVVISSTGTDLGTRRTVTVKGTAKILDDEETKNLFYPDFARRLFTDESEAAAFEQGLRSPLRVVLEVTPVKFVTHDGVKMAAHVAGTLDESTLAEPLESDTLRLERELERRARQ